MEIYATGSCAGNGNHMTSGQDSRHADEPLEDQGKHQWTSPGADHATDMNPGKGHLFVTQVVLQGLVDDGCGVIGLTRGVL